MCRDVGRDVPDMEKLSASKLWADFAFPKKSLQTPFSPELGGFSQHQKHPFVHNSVCSQFTEGLFAFLAECAQFCLRAF